ncbi:MAG: hypothetical protein JWN70_4811 [Planctomycetaceae bacterium]|nr:hypothetical protein [Planctomycetaceae bacterium]
MSIALPFTREELLSSRSPMQHAWDLFGIPFRFVAFPDAWNKRVGWSSLEEERLRAVMPKIQGRLLDVGAGTNTLVRTYRGEGVGIDVFDFGGGTQIVPDTRELPFADGSFDTITYLACLNHIPYREDALREGLRVLKPGGRIVATMINRWLGDVGHKIWWYSEEKHRGGMLPGETGGLDVKEMKSLLTGSGYTNVQFSRFCYGLNGLYVAEKPRN